MSEFKPKEIKKPLEDIKETRIPLQGSKSDYSDNVFLKKKR